MTRAVIAALLLCVAVSAAPPAVCAGVSDPFPGVAASYLLAVDGTPVWQHRPDRRLPLGSLTKMMTALLVLERGRLAEVATVGAGAARETGTRLGLREGDRIRVAELLAATVIGSANDAARALAEHLDGTEERFVRRMNSRAAALGMRNTRFANATGHDDPGLYGTARDMAALAEAVMADERFASLASTVRWTVRTADGSRSFPVENRNEMVGRYRGAAGVKTGYTPAAGPCLAAWANRSGTRVLLVLLNAPNRWWDAVEMMDRAFEGAAAPGGEGGR